MSSSTEKDTGLEDGMADEPAVLENGDGDIGNHGEHDGVPDGGRIIEILEEERAGPSTPVQNGLNSRVYKNIQETDQASEDVSLEQTPHRAESPTASILSDPDHTPSVQV